MVVIALAQLVKHSKQFSPLEFHALLENKQKERLLE